MGNLEVAVVPSNQCIIELSDARRGSVDVAVQAVECFQSVVVVVFQYELFPNLAADVKKAKLGLRPPFRPSYPALVTATLSSPRLCKVGKTFTMTSHIDTLKAT